MAEGGDAMPPLDRLQETFNTLLEEMQANGDLEKAFGDQFTNFGKGSDANGFEELERTFEQECEMSKWPSAEEDIFKARRREPACCKIDICEVTTPPFSRVESITREPSYDTFTEVVSDAATVKESNCLVTNESVIQRDVPFSNVASLREVTTPPFAQNLSPPKALYTAMGGVVSDEISFGGKELTAESQPATPLEDLEKRCSDMHKSLQELECGLWALWSALDQEVKTRAEETEQFRRRLDLGDGGELDLAMSGLWQNVHKEVREHSVDILELTNQMSQLQEGLDHQTEERSRLQGWLHLLSSELHEKLDSNNVLSRLEATEKTVGLLKEQVDAAVAGRASGSLMLGPGSGQPRRNSGGMGLRSRLEALAGELSAEAETRVDSERKVWQAIELEAHERKSLGDRLSVNLRELSESVEERHGGPFQVESDFSTQLLRFREDFNADRAIRAGESVALSRYMKNLHVRLTDHVKENERRVADLHTNLESEICNRKLLGEEMDFKIRGLRRDCSNNGSPFPCFDVKMRGSDAPQGRSTPRTTLPPRDSSCPTSKVVSSRDTLTSPSPGKTPPHRSQLNRSDTLSLAIAELRKQRVNNADSDFPLQFEDLSQHIQTNLNDLLSGHKGTYAGKARERSCIRRKPVCPRSDRTCQLKGPPRPRG